MDLPFLPGVCLSHEPDIMAVCELPDTWLPVPAWGMPQCAPGSHKHYVVLRGGMMGGWTGDTVDGGEAVAVVAGPQEYSAFAEGGPLADASLDDSARWTGYGQATFLWVETGACLVPMSWTDTASGDGSWVLVASSWFNPAGMR